MEIKCKDWKIEKGQIAGTYSVMAGEKEVATNSFNSQYGGEKIGFSAKTMKLAKELDTLVNEEIENNFRSI